MKRFALVCFTCLSLPLGAADVALGASTATILDQLGPPVARAERSDRLVFLYPDGGRVEFLDGKVVTLQPPLPRPHTEAVDAARVATPSAPKAAIAATAAPPRPATVGALAIAALVQFLFLVAALKLALGFWRNDALWRGIFAIAAIDVALRAGLAHGLPASRAGLGAREVLLVGISAVVLVATIRVFTFNRRLALAVFTAASAKFLVAACNVFIRLGLPALLLE